MSDFGHNNRGFGPKRHDNDQEVDATITIEEKQDTNIVPITEAMRHPLLATRKKKKKYVKEVEKEMSLDLKLGLNPEETARKALMRDIDELTHSRDCEEISKKELEKVFKMGWINLCYCKPFNFVQKCGALWQILMGTPACAALGFFSLTFIPLAIIGYTLATWTAKNRWDTLFNGGIVAIMAAAVVFTLCWMSNAFNFRFEKLEDSQPRRNDNNNNEEKDNRRTVTFLTMGVSLDIVPLNETEVEIPRGAKLKVAEAFDTKIFESFVIASPKFNVKKHQIDIHEKVIPRFTVDPAICGVTADNRLFMIVCWDKKKDIYRMKRSIRRFKRYKIDE